MFKKSYRTHNSMSTPPSSPQFIYSGSMSDNSDSRMDLKQQNIGALSPPLTPLRSLSQTTQQLTSQQETLTLPPLSLHSEIPQHMVLYSGDMILCTPQSRFSRQKRCYCILTPTCLVRFKSFDKAKKAYPNLIFGGGSNSNDNTPVKPGLLQDQKIMTSLEHVFAIYKTQLSAFQQAIRINFMDSTDLSKPPGSLTLVPLAGNDVPSSSLISIWVHALRTALEPYLPGLITINSAEQFAAIERTKKQNDQASPNHPTVIHKVILKTTKISSKPSSASSLTNDPTVSTLNSASTTSTLLSTPSSSSSPSSPSIPVEQKDIYIPVIFLLGQNSLYILPSKSDHDDYRRYVARDRYGLMAITGIIVHDSDDTITIDLCTLQGPSHRLKLISSVGRLLVCAIQKAIQRLVPHFPSPPYTLVCPSIPSQRLSLDHDGNQNSSSPVTHWRQYLSQPWQQQKISSQSIQNQQSSSTSSNNNNNNSLYHRITNHLDAVLMAYCAALNLDKRRFAYTISKSQQRSRLYSINVLPSNEINGNFASYSKYELLALIRSLRHMDVFDSVSFKDIRLAPLATWPVTKADSWTQKDITSMCFPTMLANEIFLLLSHNNRIRSLDLRSSHYNNSIITNDTTSLSTTPLTRLPTTMSLQRTMTTNNDGADATSPTSPVAPTSLQLSSISTSTCQQCTIQAILLAIQLNRTLNLSTLLVDNHIVHDQDIDLFSQLILMIAAGPNPSADIDLQQQQQQHFALTGLRHLSFRRSQLSTAGMEDLLLAITQGPLRDWIEQLDLQENKGLISTEIFTQVWKKCKRLTRLGVSCDFRSGDTLDLVQHPKVMNELDLSGSQMEDEHLGEICAWLTHHATTMRPSTKTQFDLCLVLARCGLHGQHVHRLVHAVSVPHHRRLHFTLKLGDNPLIKQVAYQPWLWSSLAKYGPTCLSLQNIVWESATLRELFESLIHNNMVERLDLSGTTVDKALGHGSGSSSGRSSVEDNTKAMMMMTTMTTTTTSTGNNNNMIRVARRTSTSTSTSSASESTILTRHNDNSASQLVPYTFDLSTVQALALLFEKMTHLTSFYMDAEQQDDIYKPMPPINNKSSPRKQRMTHAGTLLSSTFRHLACNPTTSFSSTITTISIKHHGLGDSTIQALCEWCKYCPSMQSLNVDGNLLTIAGFRSLLDLVNTNSNIHDLPRPELDFRQEIHRLESQAWQLQESEGELQYLVIHMVGVDSRRARALIDDQTAAREAIMIDRSQLPLVADQLEQQVQSNATLYQRKSKHITVQPYWPSTTDLRPVSSTTCSSSSTSSMMMMTMTTPTSSTYTRQPSITKHTIQPSPSTSSSSSINDRIRQSSVTSSIYSFYQDRPMEILSEALPPPTCPLPAIPSFTSL